MVVLVEFWLAAAMLVCGDHGHLFAAACGLM